MLADLAGFTSYSERREAAEVARCLSTYFGVAIPEVERHRAEVDRLIGDAVFATFASDGHTERAARAALELQEATGAVAAEHPDWPLPRRRAHRRGERRRPRDGLGRTYSVVGDTVNLGSRIEGLAPVGGRSRPPARAISGAPPPSRSARSP